MPNGLFSMLNPWLQSIDGAAIFIQHGVHIIITVILVVDLFPKPAEELRLSGLQRENINIYGDSQFHALKLINDP